MELKHLLNNLQIADNHELEKSASRLAHLRNQEGFVEALLMLTNNRHEDELTRKTAVSCLSDNVRSYYCNTSGEVVAECDKLFLKRNILHAITANFNVPVVGETLREILQRVVEYDYPSRWSNLPNDIVTSLNSCTKEEDLAGSLSAVQCLVLFRINDRSKPFIWMTTAEEGKPSIRSSKSPFRCLKGSYPISSAHQTSGYKSLRRSFRSCSSACLDL